jgi:hypothetical protein
MWVPQEVVQQLAAVRPGGVYSCAAPHWVSARSGDAKVTAR